MYLDERSTAVLLEIIKNPNLSNDFIKDKYELSNRQIEYSLEKINTWLKYNEAPEIIQHQGRYVVDQEIYRLLDYRHPPQNKLYIASKEERQTMIPLYILLRKEVLSLDHVADRLNVSKNTVLNDIKESNHYLADYDCEIVYSRSQGYYVHGKEWNKRRQMLHAMQKLSSTTHTLKLLKDLVGGDGFRVYRIQKMLERIEKETNQNFIDERLKTLALEIEAYIQRVEKGRYVQLTSIISFDDLFGTKEYDFISDFLSKEGIKKESEKLFLTLHLLTVNRSPGGFSQDSDEILVGLEEAIEASLSLFERNAVIELKNKNELQNTLMLHLKPAYYRIKYNLTTQYSFPKEIEYELASLKYLVGMSIQPLRDFLGRDIPYHEEMFITLYISSHLAKSQNVNLNKKSKKALIVCPNGVTLSTIVYNNLKTLFPEIEFLETMSIREYEASDTFHDIVFSTTPLVPKKNSQIFIVNKVMEDVERIKLRERVMREVFHYPYQEIDIQALVKEISKHAIIKDQDALENSLENMFYKDHGVLREVYKESKENAHLYDLLKPDFINFANDAKSWQEIIKKTSAPLLKENIIEERYCEKMISLYPDVGDHIVLNRNLAIPHAGIDQGVNKLGMSLLILRKPYISGGFKIQFVVVIATPNKKLHFDSLMELMELSGNPTILRALYSAKDSHEAHRLIKKFIKDGEVDGY